MKRIIFILCILFTFSAAAYADGFFVCQDPDGKKILTDKPQDGMSNCIRYSGSDEDLAPAASKKGGKITGCDAVPGNMNSAREYLNRAAKRKFSEIEEGREDVRRSLEYLDEAQTASTYCPCSSLSSEISQTAQYARDAVNEASPSQFSELLTNALRSFNNSLEAYKRCR